MTNTNYSKLLDVQSHFAFGKNWASYAELIGDQQIAEAVQSLSHLLGGDRLDGKRFLDIGCGSGLHSLAALRLGAAEVIAVDIDEDSIATTRAVLARHAHGAVYTVLAASVFDLDPDRYGQFEMVYSWGVLHHTGSLDRALRCAVGLVTPGGQFVFALYRKTWMCGFWKLEKRWYSHAGPAIQKFLGAIYVALYRIGLWVTGRSFRKYVATYKKMRGMDFYHNVHDWLGGYPYESILADEVAVCMAELGLTHVRSFVRRGRLFGRHAGVLGSGCDEYVYARPARPITSLLSDV